jgi:hypothetical protein
MAAGLQQFLEFQHEHCNTLGLQQLSAESQCFCGFNVLPLQHSCAAAVTGARNTSKAPFSRMT